MIVRCARNVLVFGTGLLFCDLVTAEETEAEPSPPMILAHYMPWYTAKPTSNHWGWHWTMNHFDPEKINGNRREVASKYYPLAGAYDSGDPSVLEYHLLLMKTAGIDGVIVDWYGLTDLHDYAVLHENTRRLIAQINRFGMKFVICYEDQTLGELIKHKRIAEDNRIEHVVTEIDWMASQWFTSENYVKQDGLPVLLSFGNAGLTNSEWTRTIGSLKSPVAYYSEHIRREGAVGGFDWPIPAEGVGRTARFAEIAGRWPNSIPVVFPRFVDIYAEAKVRESYPSIDDNQGDTFRETLTHALRSNPRLIQIATWNDWGEGTSIEPSLEFGYRDLEFLQQTRHSRIDPAFSAKKQDLRLPLRLLRLRQEGHHPDDKLNTIAENISAGRLSLARRQIEYLSADKD